MHCNLELANYASLKSDIRSFLSSCGLRQMSNIIYLGHAHADDKHLALLSRCHGRFSSAAGADRGRQAGRQVCEQLAAAALTGSS